MGNKCVSVIMATRNNSTYLKEAIESVVRQTYSPLELIIVNDASTDNTEEILSKIASKDKRITVLTNEKKQGLSESLNHGIAKAQGVAIARIDSDDIWNDPQKLEKQVAFLEHNPEVGMVGCWGQTIDINGHVQAKLQYPTSDESIRQYLLIENCFIHSSVLVRTSLIRELHGYDDQYKFAQDYDLWLRIGEKAKLYNLPLFMVLYRKNPMGISQRNYKTQIQETIQTVRFHKSMYPYGLLGLFLWHVRLSMPDTFRESLSQFFRTKLFFGSL